MRHYVLGLGAASLLACGGAPGGLGSSSQAVTVCPAGGTVEGIDVYSAQGGNTNWAQVQDAGRGFAIIKATEGTGYTNPYFGGDWSNTASVGIVRGAYHYFHPSIDPVAQANYFVGVMGKLGPADLPPTASLFATDGWDAGAVVSSAQTFLKTVQTLTGRVPTFFTSPAQWAALGNPTGFESYGFWDADDVSPCPNVPGDLTGWKLWQYSSSGTVPGVSTSVFLDRFNGTLADLKDFTVQSSGLVQGPIATEYFAIGGPSGVLGYPTTAQLATVCGGGQYNNFQGGAITYTPTAGAHETHGPIRDKWATLNYECSVLGFPTSDTTVVGDGSGTFSQFEHGVIYDLANVPTAYEVHGPILSAWQSQGGATGALGFPVSDVTPTGSGFESQFQNGVIDVDGQGNVTVTLNGTPGGTPDGGVGPEGGPTPTGSGGSHSPSTHTHIASGCQAAGGPGLSWVGALLALAALTRGRRARA